MGWTQKSDRRMPTPDFRICLAPMRGLTGYIYRNCYATHFEGIDWAITPFLTTFQSAHIKPSRLLEVLPENNLSMPVAPQILSKNADKFISLAHLLYDLGYEHINWNLGCPFARVAKKGRGSGLLPHSDLVARFLDAVMPAITNRLSIKTRLGRYHPDEMEALLPVFNNYPLEALIIHPRTGIQMYTGTPDLDHFAKTASQSMCKVIYNGDINTVDDFLNLQQRFAHIDTWMIGRGVVANPFLPMAIKGSLPPGPQRIEIFRQFHNDLFDRYAEVRHGPGHLVDSMKGYWNYFAQSFPNGPQVLKKIRKAKHVDQYQSIVNAFLETENGDQSFI